MLILLHIWDGGGLMTLERELTAVQDKEVSEWMRQKTLGQR